MTIRTGRIGALAEKLNEAYYRRTWNSDKICQGAVELIPTDHATAILDNCLRIVFFPYGAKAPASREEFDRVVEQMTATLGELRRNIAEHNITEKICGRGILAQYNANAIFYGFGSIRIRENIATEMRAINLLVSQAATPEDREGYARIRDVATKLAHTVYEATSELENNFATLAACLVETDF
ncbi:MAG: hypothetical protein HDQ91_00170 [Desulfovibrio sp.]|nr:hypothetical protein [Desulfovibrio sp.]